MANPRVRKVADRIQVIVAEMLERRIKDPRLGFVTVTDVRVSGDTQQASVFYTVLGEEEQVVGSAAALESAKGLIRSEVAKQLGMRHAPTLEFIHDALPDTARHFEEVLAQTREADAARRRAGGRGGVRRRGRPVPQAARARRARGPRRGHRRRSERRGAGRAGRRRQAGRDDLARRGRPDPAARRHPQGRPRRHARPDGDRRAAGRGQPGHPAARPPHPHREGVRRHGPARCEHHHRRRGGGDPHDRVGASTSPRTTCGRPRGGSSATSSRSRRRSRRSRWTASAPTPGSATARTSTSRPDRSPSTSCWSPTCGPAEGRPRRRRLGALQQRHLHPGDRPRPRRRARRRRAPHRAAAYGGRAVHARRRARARRAGGAVRARRRLRRGPALLPDVRPERGRRPATSATAASSPPSSASPARWRCSTARGRFLALYEQRGEVAAPVAVFCLASVGP